MSKRKQHEHVISSVAPGSIAQELELEPGDVLVAINGKKIEDVFDYHYLSEDTFLEVLVKKKNGEEWLLEVEKEEDETLGVTFENSLMDEYRSCKNRCIFCFIDQMPKGMRKTLYFKDDDSRLSFLQGNYVTLTNMTDDDIRRIIRYRLEPINISFHTTNPRLRCKMLNNRFAGEALKKVDMLFDAGTKMNGQIVLCRGINDGAELERTISDLSGYLPHLKSVSVVPVGLTRHREGLYPLEPFEKEDALQVLEQIRRWQEKIFEKWGTHFVHASDEWYLMAGQDFPPEETYDGYLQIENGVGMMRSFLTEFDQALSGLNKGVSKGKTGESDSRLSIATGRLAYPVIRKLLERLRQARPDVQVSLYEITNDFFGERITVAGLITGQDLIRQLTGKPLGQRLLLPSNMLRAEGDCFLDDVTLQELKNALQVPVEIVELNGKAFIDAILGER